MATTTYSLTKTATGAVAMRMITHLSFVETGGSTAKFTLRQTDGSGAVVCTRTLAANESDDVDFSSPWIDVNRGGFHITKDSGTLSVIISGKSINPA